MKPKLKSPKKISDIQFLLGHPHHPSIFYRFYLTGSQEGLGPIPVGEVKDTFSWSVSLMLFWCGLLEQVWITKVAALPPNPESTGPLQLL